MKGMQIIGLMFIAIIIVFLGKVGGEVGAMEREMELDEEDEIIEIEEIEPDDEIPTEILVITEDKEEPIPVWTDIKLSAEMQMSLYEKCKELDVNYWFVIAMCESESSFIENAQSRTGAYGYMQIAPCNWKRMLDEYNLDVHEPLDNLLCGTYMLNELANKYDTFAQVVMSYKCGEARAKELIEQGVILDCVDELGKRIVELENTHRDYKEETDGTQN